MRKGRDKKKLRKIKQENNDILVATNVIASRLPNQLEHQQLVPKTEMYEGVGTSKRHWDQLVIGFYSKHYSNFA